MPDTPAAPTSNAPGTTYSFLLDAYETEILKIAGIWSAFPDEALGFRPSPKSRTVLEQMEHQVQSEGRWMSTMLGIDTGDPNPAEKLKRAYVEKYRADAARRLAILRAEPDSWWGEPASFFDVTRSRAWIFTRRINHSAHHRGQLIVYLRLLGVPVPSVYGPTADTNGKVIYQF
ncbi:MAG TPA: DinB family protein [Candidatus Polarisedimenticolia bacterium]|nr:DinB family protein [Candidatus Polarisedimenticolia bacterium]